MTVADKEGFHAEQYHYGGSGIKELLVTTCKMMDVGLKATNEEKHGVTALDLAGALHQEQPPGEPSRSWLDTGSLDPPQCKITSQLTAGSLCSCWALRIEEGLS